MSSIGKKADLFSLENAEIMERELTGNPLEMVAVDEEEFPKDILNTEDTVWDFS